MSEHDNEENFSRCFEKLAEQLKSINTKSVRGLLLVTATTTEDEDELKLTTVAFGTRGVVMGMADSISETINNEPDTAEGVLH